MSVTFYLDPTCPYTWRASRWIRDVAARRGEDLRWRLLSLSILNEGRDVPEQYRAGMAWGTGVLRVLAATDSRHGQEAFDRLYTAIGERIHERDGDKDATTIAAAIADAGLPEDLATAAGDATLDTSVRASHDESQDRVGTETGSPVTAFGDGPAFFGPVLSSVPPGDEADRLFDALRLLSTVPQFSELKRARQPS